MDHLTMDLMRLTKRNKDGSFGTQKNRQRGLGNGSTFKLAANSDLIGDAISMEAEQWARMVARQLAQYRRLDEADVGVVPDDMPNDGAPMPWGGE